MKKETIQNVVGILRGDVWVNVDIQFQEMAPNHTTEEKLALARVNSELGMLAHEIKEEVKKKIDAYFEK